MRIDAHHHLWRYNADEFGWIGEESAMLRRDFLVDEFEMLLKGAGVQAAVVVQARCSVEETRWLLECAAASQRIIRVVGWAPLMQERLAAFLDEVAGERRLAGFREIVQDQPAGFLAGTAFNNGIRHLTARGFTYDLLVRAHQLEEAIRFVDAHPQQRFVLDHAGKPEIAQGRREPWQTQMKELAERPHVWCKLSGLVTEAQWDGWTEQDLRPYLDVCLEAFGPERCMVGSDWPVCLLASSYGRWWQLLEHWAGSLSGGEQAKLFGETAAYFYGWAPTASTGDEAAL